MLNDRVDYVIIGIRQHDDYLRGKTFSPARLFKWVVKEVLYENMLLYTMEINKNKYKTHGFYSKFILN